MPRFKVLESIIGNLAQNRFRERIEETTKPVYAALLKQGQDSFRRKLSTTSVSNFKNTIASKRLYKSYENRLPVALKWGKDSATLSFGVRSESGRRDPAKYVDPLDDTDKRGQKGPSTARVRQWLSERGIISRNAHLRHKVMIPGSDKPITVRSLVFIVKRSIKRKTQQREYKSLQLSKMFADLVDIGNRESPFRKGIRRQITNAVLGGA